MNIPREIRNLQTSYKEGQKNCMDEAKELVGFAFANEKVEEYPEEPQTLQNAWNNPDSKNKGEWRDAIRKEFSSFI